VFGEQLRPQVRHCAELLDERDLAVPTTGHKYPVAPAAVREAIARRDVNRAQDGAP